MAFLATKETIFLGTILLSVLVYSSAAATATNSAAKITEQERKLLILKPINTQINVTVINDLGRKVSVHCKSKDDDLGIQRLWPHGSFRFHFHKNYWETTLFFCRVVWPGKGNVHYFEAFDYDRDHSRCHRDCCWNLKPNGPCNCHKADQCYPWT